MSSENLTVWQMNLMGAAACAAMAFAAYLFVVQPVAEQQTSLQNIRAQWDAQRRRSNELGHERRMLIQELQAAQDKLELGDVKLHSIDRLNTRVADLTGLAADCSLVLHKTSSGLTISGGLYDMVSIHLAGSGDFGSAARFLHGLRDRMPDTGVVGLRLSGNPRDTNMPVSYEFDLVWYTAPSVAAVLE
ncbi:MAG: hypothetical protein ACYTJ0_05125 [Planctomycetota bacterium]|jgi:hypothetical protein